MDVYQKISSSTCRRSPESSYSAVCCIYINKKRLRKVHDVDETMHLSTAKCGAVIVIFLLTLISIKSKIGSKRGYFLFQFEGKVMFLFLKVRYNLIYNIFYNWDFVLFTFSTPFSIFFGVTRDPLQLIG